MNTWDQFPMEHAQVVINLRWTCPRCEKVQAASFDLDTSRSGRWLGSTNGRVYCDNPNCGTSLSYLEFDLNFTAAWKGLLDVPLMEGVKA